MQIFAEMKLKWSNTIIVSFNCGRCMKVDGKLIKGGRWIMEEGVFGVVLAWFTSSLDGALLWLLGGAGGVRGRWGGRRQSEAGGGGGGGGGGEGGREGGQRASVSQHCAVKVRRLSHWKAQPAPASSGKNGKRLASGSHDRKHNLPHCVVGGKIKLWVGTASCNVMPDYACLMHILISGGYTLMVKLVRKKSSLKYTKCYTVRKKLLFLQ